MGKELADNARNTDRQINKKIVDKYMDKNRKKIDKITERRETQRHIYPFDVQKRKKTEKKKKKTD